MVMYRSGPTPYICSFYFVSALCEINVFIIVTVNAFCHLLILKK